MIPAKQFDLCPWGTIVRWNIVQEKQCDKHEWSVSAVSRKTACVSISCQCGAKGSVETSTDVLSTLKVGDRVDVVLLRRDGSELIGCEERSWNDSCKTV